MGKMTKILIVLIFLVALGFLFFSAKIVGRVENQKAIIKSLEESITSLENTIGSLSKTIDASKWKITILNAEIAYLSRELTTTKTAKEKVERELAEAKQENSQLKTALDGEKQKVQALTNERDNLQRQVSSLTSEKKDLETALSTRTKELKIAQEKLAKLESMGILVEKEVVLPGEGKIPKIVKAIEGKVVDIKPGGIIAINFKGGIKPREGTTFYVIGSDQVKARLVLKEVYNTIMVAQMDSEEPLRNINYGDIVRLVLWIEE